MVREYAATKNDAASSAERRVNLCRAVLWKAEARALVVADRRPAEVLDALIEAGYLGDAIRFFAMALPMKQSIWWGALCIRQAFGDDLPPLDNECLAATLRWLREEGETNRREAERFARQARARTAASALAMAAFTSGGSVSRPHLPYVAPGPRASAQLVAGAILLSAVRNQPMEYRNHYRQYLAIGQEVAAGRLGWLSVPVKDAEPVTMRVDPPHQSAPAPHGGAHPRHDFVPVEHVSRPHRRQPPSE